MAKYKAKTAGDVLIHEESAIVCRDSVVIANQTAAAFTAVPGQPIDASGNVVLATAEASTVGLLLESVALGASETTALKYGIVARGPCVIDEQSIALVDSAGASYTVATIVTALEALGMTVRQEPTVSSTQTN